MALRVLTHPSALPFLTTLIGTGGLTVGIFSFIDPIAAARIYGIPVPNSKPTITSILAPNPSTFLLPTNRSSSKEPTARELALVHALGIRNLTAGLTVLTLTGYWCLLAAPESVDDAVRAAVQQVLGVVILIGALVPMVDSWVCWDRCRDVYLTRRASYESEKKEGQSEGQSKRSMWNGHDEDAETYTTSTKAAVLHAARSLVWLAGGIWCLVA
ncbi:hypothetical protein LTR64_003112 [Lithohypha guttulata]|uniref:uncharacterized protein n=1 Tax=Lithohypha guttulata TaxID=1690604 RepID=UPI002DDF8CDD|nr:hypothetical protein LTR51_000666 [Lithohypha guttulata]